MSTVSELGLNGTPTQAESDNISPEAIGMMVFFLFVMAVVRVYLFSEY